MGYHTLAVGAVALAETLGCVRSDMPAPLSVMVSGRIAVDWVYQCQGIGLRAMPFGDGPAAEIAGIRAILVHAISPAAKRFYEERGFVLSPVGPLPVMILVMEGVRPLGMK